MSNYVMFNALKARDMVRRNRDPILDLMTATALCFCYTALGSARTGIEADCS